MRYGLLALSIMMLTSGAVAAQSAMAISDSVTAVVPNDADPVGERNGSYGALPYSLDRARRLSQAR